MRFYITDFNGDGLTPETSWVPYFPQTSPFKFYDLRLIGNVQGQCLIWTENTDIEHTALLLEPRITYIPAENDDGTQKQWTDDLQSMNTGKFNQLTGVMKAMNIPADDLAKTDTVEYVFMRLIHTHMVQRYIRYVDIFDPPIQLQSNWTDIDITIRTVAEQRLAEQMFDLTGLGSMTVEQALVFLSAQDIPALLVSK